MCVCVCVGLLSTVHSVTRAQGDDEVSVLEGKESGDDSEAAGFSADTPLRNAGRDQTVWSAPLGVSGLGRRHNGFL